MATSSQTNDGVRPMRESPTGAVRDGRQGKGRYDLISPIFLAELAAIMEKGADGPYGERNWERGMPLSWYLDSGLRHLYQWKETGDHEHLGAAAFNIMGLIHTAIMVDWKKLPAELNDVPHEKHTYARTTYQGDSKHHEQAERTKEIWAADHWKCDEPECGNSMHKTYSRCHKCGTPRPAPLEAGGTEPDSQA